MASSVLWAFRPSLICGVVVVAQSDRALQGAELAPRPLLPSAGSRSGTQNETNPSPQWRNQ
jgi:hypothetical protein